MSSRSALVAGVIALPCLLTGGAEAGGSGARASLPNSTIAVHAPAQCQGRAASIVGTLGRDEIHGTKGRDVILARAGNDLVFAGGRRDIVCGGKGQDRIVAGRGDDLLVGAGGDDVLRPGRAAYQDKIRTGRGDDVIRAKAGRYTQTCVVYRHAPGAVAVDLTAHSATGPLGNDRLYGVDCVIGSRHADQIRGRSLRPDTLYGGNGDDRLDGRGGLDFIWAEDGDDAIETGSTGVPRRRSCSVVVGGPGADEVSGGRGCQSVEGGEGADRIDVGPGGDVVISVYSDAGSRPLDYAVDVLIGRSGRDILFGQEGRDILQGGPGRDYLDAGAGDDDLFGGRHFDRGRGGGDRTGDLCVSVERARGCED